MSDQNGQITGKIIISATVVNKSNLLVGSGQGEILDFELIREDGNLFIPSSSFVGVMSKHFKKWVSLEDKDLNLHAKYLWGSDDGDDKSPSQSHIIIDDLICINETATVVIRDGVAIDSNNGRAIKGSKYDYELIEPNAEFSLNIEITLRKGFDHNTFLRFVKFISDTGKNGEYRQGAFTSHGFGQLEWKSESVKIYHLKFPEDQEFWFNYIKSESGELKKEEATLPSEHGLSLKPNRKANISGTFSIKNSLIIGASDDKLLERSLDKTHIKNSQGHPLLTSKSIRGPIRHRALKILNTIGNKNAKEIIEKLFGMVDEKTRQAKKGKIIPKEYEFDNLEKIDAKQIQSRIKIDRFTGGTMNTALLSSQPLWHMNENIQLEFEIENYQEDEIAILLLVMKDLMNEDLPIGGEKAIGRGVLKGSELKIKRDNENWFELKVIEDGSTKHDGKGDFTLVNIEKWIKTLNSN